MNRDHSPITIDNFSGLFSRGILESVPPDHMPVDDISPPDCPNLSFDENKVSQRNAFGLLAAYPGSFTHPVKRFFNFFKSDGTIYRILLDSNSHFWSNGTDLGAVAGASDFSMIALGDRAYISAFGTNGNPLSGINVKVYDGTTFRDAGGAAPAVGAFAAANGAAGVIEKGLHLIAVAYETDSGFITPPCTAIQYTAPGALKINLTNIPTGPAGTLYRHILITKYIRVFDGNVKNYMLYKIAKILDNTTTSLTIDQYDSALIDQAGYLYDELATIPAGVHLGSYRNCMVSSGAYGETSVVRVSKPGDFESFSGVDGFATVFKEDGGGINATAEFRGSLYMLKSFRTFATVDNGGPVNSWTIQTVDAGIGCEPHGIGIISGAKGTGIEGLFIASHSGLMYFQGIYQLQNVNLTWKIQAVWDQMDSGIGSGTLLSVEVLVDTRKKLIYINIPYTGGGPVNVLLVGDFQRGLDPKAIRWDMWGLKESGGNTLTFNSITFGIVNTTTYIPELQVAFASSVPANANILKLSTSASGSDNGVGMNSFYSTGMIPSTGAGVTHFNMIKLRIYNGPRIVLSLKGDAPIADQNSFVTADLVNVEQRFLCNYMNRRGRLFIRFSPNGAIGVNFTFVLERIDIFVKPLWSEVPA